MASLAFQRRLAFLMAINAITHIDIYGSYRHGHLRHVAVTIGASHAGPDVRRVIESHVC
jgi:hypothetical protein